MGHYVRRKTRRVIRRSSRNSFRLPRTARGWAALFTLCACIAVTQAQWGIVLLFVVAAVACVITASPKAVLSTSRGRTIAEFQRMTPTQFEYAIAGLCRRDGCRSVKVVGGAGDLAADVLATTPDGRRILIQAKRYAVGNPVRSPALQAVNGTYRDVHGAQLAAVVTTSTFTTDARAFGKRVGIRCFDERALAAWASRTGPAPWH